MGIAVSRMSVAVVSRSPEVDMNNRTLTLLSSVLVLSSALAAAPSVAHAERDFYLGGGGGLSVVFVNASGVAGVIREEIGWHPFGYARGFSPYDPCLAPRS